MNRNFNGCSVIIYNEEEKQLATLTIWEHDTKENFIEIQNIPELVAGERCKVLILADPVPYISLGSIHMGKSSKIVRLFKGDSKENRKNARYAVDIPAKIEGLMYNNTVYPLLSAVDIRVVSISVSGIRFTGATNTTGKGDWLQIRMKVIGTDKMLIVKVAHCKDKVGGNTEYGCRLIAREETSL